MKKIEIAYEILSESRRNLNNYAVTKSNFDLIHAHMYSIFECYAHGVISWRTVEKKFQRSLKEYVNLYKDDKQLMLEEKARMLDEYTRVLEEYKPALDEYKRVHEQKMTSNIVIKQQISESVAQQQSNFYFNKRSLKEADLKDITRLKTWNRVLENYPNLTAKDEQRVRMLTIFEGPTVDTTQLITTVVTEYGKKKKKKADEAAPATSMRPIPRRAGAGNEINIGSVSKSGGTRGIDPRVNYSPADAATLTGQPNTAPAGTPRAPVSSPRPQQRPTDLARRAGINRAVSSAMSEDPVGITPRPQATTRSNTANNDPALNYIRALTSGESDKKWLNTLKRVGNASLGIPTPRVSESAAENYIIAHAKSRMADLEPEAREAFLAQLEKSYPGIRQKIGEGYKVLPNIDRDRYSERPGLEGPFRTLSGKVVYYDPKEGSYYDPDTDMYLSYDEFKALDNDYSGMRDERDIDVKEAVAKIACLKCDEVSTAKAWQKNNGFCPKCKVSSQGVAEDINEEMSDAEVDAFHRALDAIVHKYIGHGSHEKKKDMNESKIIATGLLRDKPFRKTFKNVEAMRAWADREDADVRGYHAAPGKGEDTQESVNTVGERSMTKGEKSKEERLKKKYDDSEMKRSMKDQYGDRWEEVYYATIRKKAMEQFNEMTSAGAIAAVAQPMGKMQRRNKVKEDQMMTEAEFDESAGEKDACYHKVKSRYKVWPSAYASGALVQCRKVGAANWGNKSKK